MNFNFIEHTADIVPTQAHFCSWEGLSNLCTALLSGFFKRPFSVSAHRNAYGEGWTLGLETVLRLEELTALQEEFGDLCQVGDLLTQATGEKLVGLILPFAVAASHTTPQGVWFTGQEPPITSKQSAQ